MSLGDPEFGDRNGLRISHCPGDVGRPDGHENGGHRDRWSAGGDSRDVRRLAHLESECRSRMREQWAMPVRLPAQRAVTAYSQSPKMLATA